MTAALEVIGLSAWAADGSPLLTDVSFHVPAGALVAIAGPTGAGKTSLARALTGDVPNVTGRVCVEGRDVTHDEPARRGIGLVPQDDRLHHALSLRRTLEHTAALRRSPHADAADRHRVAGILTELGLEAQAGSPVGTLSAGQRKRAAIAVELLGHPDVVILDEPTSSLDPGYERSVMATLRGLADAGRCVLAVTHSATAIAQCDAVLYLSAGGRLAFFGPPAAAAAHFGTTDPAELFDALDRTPTSGDRPPGPPPGAQCAAAATTSQQPAPRVTAAGRATQLGTLVKRYAEVIVADRRHSAMLALQGLVLGALLWVFVTPAGLRPVPGVTGSLPPSATGVAVLLALSVTWLGTANAIREIVKERRILQRERAAGLSIAAYVASKILVLGPLSMIQAAVLTALTIARQQPPGHGAVLWSGTVELMVTMALAGLGAAAIGLLVSALVRTPDKATAALPILVITEFVLSGLRPTVSWLPGLAQLRDLAPTHWAVTAVGATVDGDPGAWWAAVAAITGLTLAAIVATAVVVRRDVPQPVRPRRGATSPAKPMGTARAARFAGYGESVRVGAVAVAGLAAVAVVVGGVNLAGLGSGASQPTSIVAAPPAVRASHPAPVPLDPLLSAAASWTTGLIVNPWQRWTTAALVDLAVAAVAPPAHA